MSTTTLRDLAARMLEHRRDLNFSDDTLTSNRYCLEAFLRWLELSWQVTTADRLRSRHLVAFQKHLRNHRTPAGRPMKPGSINCHIKAVRALLDFLRVGGYAPPRLQDAIRYVKEPQSLPTSVMQHAEVRKLLRTIDTTTPTGYRNRTMIELFYSCGIRNMELRGMDTGEVDFDNATARVRGKNNKERVVPIGRTAMRFLEGYIRAIRPFWINSANTSALFLNRFGNRMARAGVCAVFRAVRARAGLELKVTAHTMRRSCTTELVRANANLYHIKELLGHESLDTLKPYTRLTIVDLKKTHAKCHPRERDEKRERG